MGPKTFTTEAERAQVRQAVPSPLPELAFLTAAFNREVRIPAEGLFSPLERVFRVKQEWSLYRDGPSRVNRLEIEVDDTLVYRSVDRDHAWRDAQLSCRRLRPVVQSTATKRNAPNWTGLARWVAAEARADWPDARRVVLRGTSSPFPGLEPTTSHEIVVAGPVWQPVLR